MADEKSNEQAEAADEKPKGRLRAFAGNSYDDYYDAAMSDFPLPGRLFVGFVANVVNAYTKLVWPWKLEDEELLHDDGLGGRVVIMNHESMLDPVILFIRLHKLGIGMRPVFKSEFNKIWIARWFLSRAGGIPVDRGSADMKAIRRARAALQRGEYVVIFPEGTRIKHDADSEVHGGFALMAQLAKAPVQPSAIVGARELSLGRRVYARVGAPITWDQCEGKRKAQLAQMEKMGMERVFAIRDELRAEHPEIQED